MLCDRERTFQTNPGENVTFWKIGPGRRNFGIFSKSSLDRESKRRCRFQHEETRRSVYLAKSGARRRVFGNLVSKCAEIHNMRQNSIDIGRVGGWRVFLLELLFHEEYSQHNGFPFWRLFRYEK